VLIKLPFRAFRVRPANTPATSLSEFGPFSEPLSLRMRMVISKGRLRRGGGVLR
jgi:hypothetical protein